MSRLKSFIAVSLSSVLLAPSLLAKTSPGARGGARGSHSSKAKGGQGASTSMSGGAGRSRQLARAASAEDLAGAPYTCPTCERDEQGRMKVLAQSTSDFMRDTGYPYGRVGYVIRYAVPLQCGGADDPKNMQWLTIAEATAKGNRCEE
jgi:hypothetical protein